MRNAFRRPGRTSVLAVLLIAVILATACSGDPQNTFAGDGDVSSQINDLFFPIGILALVIFVLVEGVIIYIVIRFRRRAGDAFPKQSHGNIRLEIAWTIAPTLLMVGIGVPTVFTIFDLADEPDNVMEVRVVANQWWWSFEYTEYGITTANELHIPVDRPVKVILESNDVIHSFWVPRLAGKTDVVPGRTNTMWFNANEPDTYSAQCAEFCGLSHALMRFLVIADTQEDFDTWVASQQTDAVTPTDTDALQGMEFFGTTCGVCHTVTGTGAQGQVGPNLTHFASRTSLAANTLARTPENIGAWLRNPQAVKPGAKMPNLGLSEDEIRIATAYLQTLK